MKMVMVELTQDVDEMKAQLSKQADEISKDMAAASVMPAVVRNMSEVLLNALVLQEAMRLNNDPVVARYQKLSRMVSILAQTAGLQALETVTVPSSKSEIN